MIDNIKLELDHIQFHEGRPNIEFLVDDSLNNQMDLLLLLPVLTTQWLMRFGTIVPKIDNPEKKRVDFYEQVQVWA